MSELLINKILYEDGDMNNELNCPYCGKELVYNDYFGKYLGNGNWDKEGEIYKCENEECESEAFNYCFYIWLNGDMKLYEGYPC